MLTWPFLSFMIFLPSTSQISNSNYISSITILTLLKLWTSSLFWFQKYSCLLRALSNQTFARNQLTSLIYVHRPAGSGWRFPWNMLFWSVVRNRTGAQKQGHFHTNRADNYWSTFTWSLVLGCQALLNRDCSCICIPSIVLGPIYSWDSIGPICFFNSSWDPTKTLKF